MDKGSDKTETIPNEIETSKQDINHTDEVIIGREQGTTFPTKIGTSMCNALIDIGATKSCISEKILSKFTIDKNSTHTKYKHNISHRE